MKIMTFVHVKARNLSDLKSVTKAVIPKHLRKPQTHENLKLMTSYMWKLETYETCES